MNSISPAPFVIVPFAPAHLAQVRPRRLSAEEEKWLPYYVEKVGPALAAGPFAYSGIAAGEVVISAGVYELWPGRLQAWAVVGEVPRRRWPAITAKVREGIEAAHQAGYRRIEATVMRGFPEGVRWLQRLGFERRCLLPVFDQFGNDHWFFDRVRTEGVR